MTGETFVRLAYYAALPFIGAALLGFLYYAFRREPRVFAVATICSFVAFACLTADLLALFALNGFGLVAAGKARYVLGAWSLMLAYFLAEYRFRVRLLGPLLMPAALVAMLLSMFMRDAPVQVAHIPGLRLFLVLHLVLLFSAVSLLFLAFAGALLYLAKTRALKRRAAAALDGSLPGLDTSRRILVLAVNWGFPLFTAGLMLGMLYAAEVLHGAWLTDPKILPSLLIWVLYAGLFALHQNRRVSDTGLARSVLGLFAAVVLVFVATTHRQAVDQVVKPPPAQETAP